MSLYASGKLLRETYGSNILDFFYDQNGYPYALKYNGTLYYYITNLQGDVLHLTNASGTVVASYTYDPYGKLLTTTGTLASTVGAANPLRYRGYYYDTETGFYYLQSRYYDPNICRFINADSLLSTEQGVLGHNVFAYCLNNPVTYFDYSGEVGVSIWVKAIISGALAALAEFTTGGSFGDVVTAFVVGAGTELLSLKFDWFEAALLVYDIFSVTLKSIQNDANFWEVIFVIGVTLLSSIDLGITDDEIVNLTAELVFGSGTTLCTTVVQKYYTGELPGSRKSQSSNFFWDYREAPLIYSDGGSGLGARSTVCFGNPGYE